MTKTYNIKEEADIIKEHYGFKEDVLKNKATDVLISRMLQDIRNEFIKKDLSKLNITIEAKAGNLVLSIS